MRRVDSEKSILGIGKSAAGKALLRLVPELCNLYWDRVSVPVVKKMVDLPVGQVVVTDLDYLLDELIIAGLKGDFPEHVLLTEETYQPQLVLDKKKPTWVVDALDGTAAYYRKNISGFSTSIALVEDGMAWASLILNPFGLDVGKGLIGEVFFAEKEMGAFLNGERIKGGNNGRSLGEAFLAMQQIRADGIPESLLLDNFWESLRTNRPCYKTHTSQVMAYVETIIGRVDGAVMNHGAMPWDIAAALGLAKEVEGVEMTDLVGNSLNPLEKPNGVIVAPVRIHREIVRLALQALSAQIR